MPQENSDHATPTKKNEYKRVALRFLRKQDTRLQFFTKMNPPPMPVSVYVAIGLFPQ